MTDKKEAATAGTSNGSTTHTIKPIVIDGGRAVVETELGEGQDGLYVSIRIAAKREKVLTLFDLIKPVLQKAINDSKL